MKDFRHISEKMETENFGLRSKEYVASEIDLFYERVRLGDLIKISRKLIYHWALYLGSVDGQEHIVVHINGNSVLGSSSASSGSSNPGVMLDPLIEVVGTSKFRIDNEYDFTQNPSPLKDILQRLENEVEELNTCYNVFWNNCEHFVFHLRYNIKRSGQFEKIAAICNTIKSTVMFVVLNHKKFK
uniref:HRAS-like suppressor n=1 Tax=Caligus clemensi TaxID=344056 RepID=C1C2W5_CALCM|nr:HRAS-like suppressor [Caligus clemensi]